MSRDLSPKSLLGVAGAVATAVACFLPWSLYAGFPGKMLNTGFPGGARMYVLLLALAAVAVLLLDPPGRVRGMRGAAVWALVISLLTALLIGYAGGGLGKVAAGAWIAVAGSAALTASAYLLDSSSDRDRRVWSLPDADWRMPAEIVITLAMAGLALYVFVVGLGIPTSNVASGPDHTFRDAISLNDVTNGSEFLAFLFGIIGLFLVAGRIGLTASLGAITQRRRPALVTGATLAAIAFPFTQDGSPYALRIAASIGVFAAAAVGLNVVVGLAGLLDLGYIAFFGVGAYFAAIYSGSATSPIHVHLPFFLVIVLGALVAAVFGFVLGAPTLRLRGDYLAIVTLGFGEIFRISVNNLDGQSGPSLTNGPNGISNIPDLGLPGGFSFGDNHHLFGVPLPFQANYFFLEIVLVAAVMVAFLRLSDSRIGRAWVAIREDELAAAATGINTTRLKLLAFGLGATLAGAAGTVDAHVVKVAAPDSFTFIESTLLLAAVILGGMGTVPGALLGASVVYLLPEQLRFLHDLRLLVFGLVLILMMRLRPEGLVPSKRRQREFHERDDRSGALDPPPGAHA
ncbi:MAG: branched-chain amino acid transport system permease protein [Frankiales bacterium]|nr:branched-chain amino acid transport system permease protein [Frankiales bacterium]